MNLTTERLTLRTLTSDDAGFILELVNEPGWLTHIGDRQIHDLDAARGYIETGPAASYAAHGFGLWAVERRSDDQAVGICGLLKRDTLADPDVGFAFLQRHWGNGYAHEAARATLDYARQVLGYKRIVAITSPTNHASARLLTNLGMREEGLVQVGDHDSRLFAAGD